MKLLSNLYATIASSFRRNLVVAFTAVFAITPLISKAQTWTQSGYGAFGGGTLVTNSGSNIIVGTWYGIWISSDNGNSWQQSNTGLTSLNITSLYTMGGKVFAGSFYGLFSSSDDGATWTPSGLDQVWVRYLLSVNTSLVAISGDASFVSNDLGATWYTSADTIDVNAITVSNSNILVGSTSGEIFQSVDAGLTWSKITSLNSYISSMTAIGNTVIASTWNGIYRSADGGMTWTFVIANYWIDIMSNFNGVFYGAGYGNIFKSTDNGLTWKSTQGGDFPLVRQTNGTDIYALSGGLSISTDEAATFHYQGNSGLSSPTALNMASIGSTFLAGTYSGIKRSTDGGNTWGASLALTGHQITTIISIGSTFLAGTSQGVFLSNDDGVTWSASNTGLTNFSITSACTIANKIVLGTGSGVFVSSDGGSTWTSTGLTTYIYSVSTQGTIMFASSIQGISRSVDYGTTWTLVSPQNVFGAQAQLVSFGNYTVIGNSYGIHYTADTGNTWKDLTLPYGTNNNVTAIATDGNSLYFAVYGGDIFTSGLNSLQNIRQTLPWGNIYSLYASNSKIYASLTENGGASIWTTPTSDFITVNGFTPTSAKVGSLITITGSNFSSTPSKNVVEFQGYASNNNYSGPDTYFGTVVQASPTQLTVSVPPGSGSHPIKIIVNNKAVTTINSFTVIPEITEITPAAAPAGSIVTIEGSGFDCKSLTYVTFNNWSTGISKCTPTSLTVLVPEQATSGYVSFVDLAQNKYSSPSPFNIIPQINSFSPTSGPPGTSVHVLGSGFDYNLVGSNQVKFNGISATVTSVTYYGEDMYITVPIGATSGAITIDASNYFVSSPVPFLVTPLSTNCWGDLPQPSIILENNAQAGGVILHSNAKGENLWFKDGAYISNQSDSTFIISDPGNYTVRSNIDGCLSPMSNPIQVTITGIESSAADAIELFPNPTASSISINLKSLPAEMVYLSVFNSMGNGVLQSTAMGGENVDLNMASLAAGVYFIKISQSSLVAQKKVVKY